MDIERLKPETQARLGIDEQLKLAGWKVQTWPKANLGEGLGVVVREYPTDTGPADYLLFVNRKAVGVIEAKKDETILSQIEDQTLRYATSKIKFRQDEEPLFFLFEATSQVIHLSDLRDPAPRAREIFHFFKPETFQDWQKQTSSLRSRLKNEMPELPKAKLRDCQINAITGLETSLVDNRPRSLIHMATGAGKTFTAINSVYRLLNNGGAKRILFLVDTRNLGKQAQQEFHAFKPHGKETFFHENHIVQRLNSSTIDDAGFDVKKHRAF